MSVVYLDNRKFLTDVFNNKQKRKTAMQNMKELMEEYEYLKWFAQNTDFGPADGDVKVLMQQQYERDTGNKVPENWKYE